MWKSSTSYLISRAHSLIANVVRRKPNACPPCAYRCISNCTRRETPNVVRIDVALHRMEAHQPHRSLHRLGLAAPMNAVVEVGMVGYDQCRLGAAVQVIAGIETMRMSCWGFARYAAHRIILTLLATASVAYGVDIYNPVSRQLSIPTLDIVNIGEHVTYSNVVVTVGSIVTYPSGQMPLTNVDTLDPSSGELTVPAVMVDGATVYNAVITVAAFDSIGSESAPAADPYDGSVLTVRRILVGNTIYSNVKVTVASIVNVAGGFPATSADSYDPSTGELSMPAVQYGNRVYANVVIRIGAIRSITSSLMILYTFGPDVSEPNGSLIMDSVGTLYGTTRSGGSNGAGTVFKLTQAGALTVLYSFTGGADGGGPSAGLVMDGTGNLYGTTSTGGAYGNNGTVFKVTPAGSESVLYSFAGISDGSNPSSTLIMDSAGNMYGTTPYGGSSGANGHGTVFRVTSSGQQSVLHSFSGGADGGTPLGGVIMDSAGNLYGTTQVGGTHGNGTVFRITHAGAESVIHSFSGLPDGGAPWAGLIMDSAGKLYGTTTEGGLNADHDSNRGTVFSVTPAGAESVLYSFGVPPDGFQPYAGVVRDSAGNLFGTTAQGGAENFGTVFKITPSGTESSNYSFSGTIDGLEPTGSLLMDSAGSFYGATISTIFKLKFY
jgi:uncharacterized repeat protein (TIGR03803 family)